VRGVSSRENLARSGRLGADHWHRRDGGARMAIVILGAPLPITLESMAHWSNSLWEWVLRIVRAIYARILRTPAAPVLRLPPVERLRRRLHRVMDCPDVLEVLAALDHAALRCWLAGGWGVDALLGEQTREHADLDILLDFAEEERAAAALGTVGFRAVLKHPEFHEGALMPKSLVLRDRLGRTVDMHGVDLVTWPASWFEHLRREGRLRFEIDPEDAFAEGAVCGRSVACLSAGLQVASRQVYTPTEVDQRDVVLLCSRFNLAPPSMTDAGVSRDDRV
jgi:lincosamide nucleotidyltransferase A/C/D/E